MYLRLGRRCFPFLYLFVVMPNNATDRRAGHRMMTRHAPYRGAFDTAVSTTNDRERGNRYRDCDCEAQPIQGCVKIVSGDGPHSDIPLR